MNPRFQQTKRAVCWLWPHDVLAALGYANGVAAPWLTPLALSKGGETFTFAPRKQ